MRVPVLAALVLCLCVGAGRSAAMSREHAFRKGGVSLRVPERWHVTNAPLDDITGPVQRLVVASYRVPGGRPNAEGTYVVPSGQVLAQLLEEPSADSRGFPPRRVGFALPRLTDHLEGHTGRWGELTFRQHGRAFYIFVGVGAGAEARLKSLLHVLDGLTVAARP